MPFCIKCGNEIAENAKFCTKCGNNYNSISSVEAKSTDESNNDGGFLRKASNFVTNAGNACDNDDTFSFWGNYGKCFKNYITFGGRARRRELWCFLLANMIIALVCLYLDHMIIYIFNLKVVSISDWANLTSYGWELVLYNLSNLYSLVAALPILGLYSRRLHDIGKSGWNWLWCLTIIGAFYVLYLFCLEGEAKENVYGPSPK